MKRFCKLEARKPAGSSLSSQLPELQTQRLLNDMVGLLMPNLEQVAIPMNFHLPPVYRELELEVFTGNTSDAYGNSNLLCFESIPRYRYVDKPRAIAHYDLRYLELLEL